MRYPIRHLTLSFAKVYFDIGVEVAEELQLVVGEDLLLFDGGVEAGEVDSIVGCCEVDKGSDCSRSVSG